MLVICFSSRSFRSSLDLFTLSEELLCVHSIIKDTDTVELLCVHSIIKDTDTVELLCVHSIIKDTDTVELLCVHSIIKDTDTVELLCVHSIIKNIHAHIILLHAEQFLVFGCSLNLYTKLLFLHLKEKSGISLQSSLAFKEKCCFSFKSHL